MSFRSFQDSAGADWQVFDVVPRSGERRQYDRRTSEEVDAMERDRREADRRVTVGRVSSRVLEGWLCFERQAQPAERRRLIGIPENWSASTDDELRAYLERARPVSPTPRSNEPVNPTR
jgi:hypothetical protein